jgi:hypothetical protein
MHGELLKTIDHDPHEDKKRGIPDYDRAWVHKKYGADVSWSAMIPLVAISAAIYFARVGWPF